MGIDLCRRQFLAATGLLACRRASAVEPGKGLVNGHPVAADAGMAMLTAGGNAVDAVVTAALVAGVVALPSTGIGGYGGHLVLARPNGTTAAIDFNGTAPAAATPDMYQADAAGTVKDRANAHGWLAAGVPGVLAGFQLALDRFGTKRFPDVAVPAIRLARDGFVLRKADATALATATARLAKDPGSVKLYLPSGSPAAEGTVFKNPDLAVLLESLADRGRVDDFYTGRIAAKIAAAFRANGGLVTAADLAAYKPAEVVPLALDWQGFTIHTPPPTAGGLTTLQALATLKAHGRETADVKDPATVHARVEALRVAWHDRLRLLGDPAHSVVPADKLLSAEYAKETADRVRAAVKEKTPIPGGAEGRPSGGTIHLNAVDADGLMVALTFTHGEAFGSGVTVNGLGLTLGHGMSRFDPRPGRPNSVGPGKRPLHNMCPTVATRDGKPVLALGATGGRRIPNTVFDVLAYRLGEGRVLADAVKGPRMHTEGDLVLTLEAAWPEAVRAYLKNVGYEVKTGPAANLSAIERDLESGAVRSVAR